MHFSLLTFHKSIRLSRSSREKWLFSINRRRGLVWNTPIRSSKRRSAQIQGSLVKGSRSIVKTSFGIFYLSLSLRAQRLFCIFLVLLFCNYHWALGLDIVYCWRILSKEVCWGFPVKGFSQCKIVSTMNVFLSVILYMHAVYGYVIDRQITSNY